jgi:hypothetical protein
MDVNMRMRDHCKRKYSSGKRFVVALTRGSHQRGTLRELFFRPFGGGTVDTPNVFKMMLETFD